MRRALQENRLRERAGVYVGVREGGGFVWIELGKGRDDIYGEVPKNNQHFSSENIFGSFLAVNRLSLQSGKVCSGKLERIFPSIDFSSEFSQIHAKETPK